MNVARPFTLAAFVAAMAFTSGCGGGGSASPVPAPTPVTVPTSGSYGWLLKAQGQTSSIKYGLSLVHPSQPAAEFVVEASTGLVSDARVVSSGTVDPSSLTVSALQPYALVYIIGGDVRRVPLQANGTAPAALVQKAGTSSACSFLVEAPDYATPEASRFAVSTVGADNVCGTADDGWAEVRLSAAAPGITLTPQTTETPLAMLRDPATLVPRAWLGATHLALWAGGTVAVPSSMAPINAVLQTSYRSALLTSANGLALLDFGGGTAVTGALVGTTATSGWNAIGLDSQYYYVYRNSGDSSGTWQALRVSRATAGAELLGTGSGEVKVASLGRGVIYLTVAGSAANQLLRLDKASPGAAPVLVDSGSASTLATVVTSAADVHQLWRVTGVGTPNPAYQLQMIDETGASLASSAGGFPMLLAGGSSVRLDASESRTLFVWAEGYGARGFSGASLKVFDAATRKPAVSIGTLPGSNDYGNDFVFSNVSGGTTGFMTGFSARSVNGVVQAAGTKVFSFDAATAASLSYTSQQQ